MNDESPPISPSSSPLPRTEVLAYMQLWAQSMGQVLGQIADTPFGVESLQEAPSATQPVEEDDLRVTIVAAGALRGEMGLRMPLHRRFRHGATFSRRNRRRRPNSSPITRKPSRNCCARSLATPPPL
jgi:hypothetical protein